MASGKYCNRRSFFVKSAKATAALTLLGVGISKASPQMTDPEDLAYCCYSCNSCPKYGSSCDGCRGTNVSGYCANCTVRLCAMDKGIVSCALCEDLEGCDKSLWQNYPSMKSIALSYQRQWLASPVKNLKNNNIHVYPNPVTDWMTIELFNTRCDEYSIFDLDGSPIGEAKISNPTTRIDVSDLKPGNYMLIIKSKGQIKLKWKFSKI